jgi:hypothetical protein
VGGGAFGCVVKPGPADCGIALGVKLFCRLAGMVTGLVSRAMENLSYSPPLYAITARISARFPSPFAECCGYVPLPPISGVG